MSYRKPHLNLSISEGTPIRTALYRIIPYHQQDYWHQSIGQYQYHQ